uniref:Uncharacterized protein n=1 Tax=Amphiprion ocellaris TaxID=80972 RepID=A0A3Q1BT84_AMPOC
EIDEPLPPGLLLFFWSVHHLLYRIYFLVGVIFLFFRNLAPGHGPGLAPGLGPGLARGHGLSLAPGLGPGLVAGLGPGLAPGHGPSLAPGLGPGLAPGLGPGLAVGLSPGLAAGLGPGLAADSVLGSVAVAAEPSWLGAHLSSSCTQDEEKNELLSQF